MNRSSTRQHDRITRLEGQADRRARGRRLGRIGITEHEQLTPGRGDQHLDVAAKVVGTLAGADQGCAGGRHQAQTVRAQWPADKPLSVRISATDWMDGGLTDDDALTMVRAFRGAGIDLIDVSTGQTVPDQKPAYGRMWQTPFADEIRNELGIATMAVGNIYEPDHVNSIIASGRADLCAVARPHLANPAWTLQAAAQQGYEQQWWPNQYLRRD